MEVLASVSSVLSMFALTPVISLMFFIIFLASIGKSLGVRRMYVSLLVKIFEVRYFHLCHTDIYFGMSIMRRAMKKRSRWPPKNQ